VVVPRAKEMRVMIDINHSSSLGNLLLLARVLLLSSSNRRSRLSTDRELTFDRRTRDEIMGDTLLFEASALGAIKH
jgi:hypothetical protein